MKLPLFTCLVLGWCALSCRANTKPEIVALGHNTYSLTRIAATGFARDTDKLKTEALEDAAAYCAQQHKELRVISSSSSRPRIPLTGFASAKVVFKALDAGDPELHAPLAPPTARNEGEAMMAPPPPAAARSSTDALYDDLMKLDELRKRGILTDEEFQAQKKKLLEKGS